MATGDKEFL
jgi:hypothetical protein